MRLDPDLRRQVGVLADRRALGHGRDQVAAEVLRVRAGEADAFDAVDAVAFAQELGEGEARAGRQVAAVGVDVLTEQCDFAHSAAGQLLDLADDLLRRAAHLLAAHGRHDAVRANRVTAHRDLHPSLIRTLTTGGQLRRESALLTGAEASPGTVSFGFQPLPQLGNRARPEGEVHLREMLEQVLALHLGEAAADREQAPWIGVLERFCQPQVRRQPRLGLFANGAGVEDHQVGLLERRRLPQAQFLEHALDPLGIVSVHLTAEGSDEVRSHALKRSGRSAQGFGMTAGRAAEQGRTVAIYGTPHKGREFGHRVSTFLTGRPSNAWGNIEALPKTLDSLQWCARPKSVVSEEGRFTGHRIRLAACRIRRVAYGQDASGWGVRPGGHSRLRQLGAAAGRFDVSCVVSISRY